MESSAAGPGFGKIWSWLKSCDRGWDLSLNTPFFGSHEALYPHFFTLAVQIKDTWPFLTFQSIHPEKHPTQMVRGFGCSGTLRDDWKFSPRGKNPRCGRSQYLCHTIPGETVSLWVFGGPGYSRLLFQPPDTGPSHWSIYIYPPPGTIRCVMGHGLLEKPWSALFISSKRIII